MCKDCANLGNYNIGHCFHLFGLQRVLALKFALLAHNYSEVKITSTAYNLCVYVYNNASPQMHIFAACFEPCESHCFSDIWNFGTWCAKIRCLNATTIDYETHYHAHTCSSYGFAGVYVQAVRFHMTCHLNKKKLLNSTTIVSTPTVVLCLMRHKTTNSCKRSLHS